MLPLLLTAVNQRRISIDEIVRLTNINPQKIFRFQQDKNTFIEVDMEKKYIIENKNLKTKCGWSPFDGWEVRGKVKAVYLRGTKVFKEREILVPSGFGRNII
jgi:dihydroorotase-like cyclic amidohydrolase